MQNDNKQLLKFIAEVQAISQTGLTFARDWFDVERYERLIEIGAELAALCTNKSTSHIKDVFYLDKGYATPKVVVRSFVLKDDRVLLVKERCDGLWTLPGGFADVSETPSQAVVRETKEESGYDVKVVRLLALWDKFEHDHPLNWPHIYQFFFHCEYVSGTPLENIEICEIDFFDIDKIPPLSLPRVTHKQILSLYQLAKDNTPTVFD
jgi:ADP-ribose pyrophosphatase YjhB (NUDIX family)